jgi:thiamine pyrophosphate-dependent acetolactate synthase large subunit-like protein
VAAFAAGAEAHLTNEIAVCAGSCGPGNLHHCTYDQFVCTYDQVIEKGRCYGNESKTHRDWLQRRWQSSC